MTDPISTESGALAPNMAEMPVPPAELGLQRDTAIPQPDGVAPIVDRVTAEAQPSVDYPIAAAANDAEPTTLRLDATPVPAEHKITLDSVAEEEKIFEEGLPDGQGLIDAVPGVVPQPTEVPEAGLEVASNGTSVIPHLSTEAANMVASKVDKEGNPAGKIDAEQARVLEAHVQNIKAALAATEADFKAAQESFAAALQLIENGPQNEYGTQIGIDERGRQTTTRKADMDNKDDLARIAQLTQRQDLMAAASATVSSPESASPSSEPLTGRGGQPLVDRVPTQEELEEIRVPAATDVQPATGEI